jgi:hypothetical protein
MKKFIPFIIVFALFAAAANAQQMRNTTPVEKIPATVQAAASEEDKAEKRSVTSKKSTQEQQSGGEVIKGVVVSFTDMIKGSDGRINKGEAFEMVDRGQPIGFLVGSQFYFVFNNEGEYDGKNLANFAGLTAVGIIGHRTTKDGLKVIKAQKIRSME